jgi:hypothetical protein
MIICDICKCEILPDKHMTADDGIITHTWRDDCITALQARIDALEKEAEYNRKVCDATRLNHIDESKAWQKQVDALAIPADILETVIKAIDLQIRWTKDYVIDSDESLDNLQRALDYFTGGK